MKICIINNLFSPYNRGGAENIVKSQAQKLSQQGNDVFIITTRPFFNKQAGPAREKEYKIYRFYPLNIFSVYYINKYPFILRAVWRAIDVLNIHSYFKIRSIIKKERPDIAYMHNLTGIGYLIPILIKKLKIKYIQIMHDVALIYPSGLLIYGKEKPVLITQVLIKIYSRITKYLFNSADEVHFPSFWLKELYEKWNFFSDSKKKVVRNFRINTEDLLKHKKLKKQGEINFLYLGQIEEYKGILFLIETLHKLQALPYRLRVVGQGSQLKRAKEIAKDNPNIVFYGYQAPAQLNNFFSQSDFTIVPSICYENSPNVIYESLQAKIPVIAAKIGGIPELIKHKKNGLLFKAGQANGLLKAVKMSINLSQ